MQKVLGSLFVAALAFIAACAFPTSSTLAGTAPPGTSLVVAVNGDGRIAEVVPDRGGRFELRVPAHDVVEFVIVQAGLEKPLMVRGDAGVVRTARMSQARRIDAGAIEVCDCDGDGAANETVTRNERLDGEAKVTICHATGSETNPYVEITISANALPAHEEHQDGEDIIPAPEDGCPDGEDGDCKIVCEEKKDDRGACGSGTVDACGSGGGDVVCWEECREDDEDSDSDSDSRDDEDSDSDKRDDEDSDSEKRDDKDSDKDSDSEKRN